MMFHLAQQNLIARTQIRPAPSRRDEVDAFGATAREDDRVRIRRIDEFGNLDARLFVTPRCHFTQVMRRAVQVGVLGFVKLARAFDDSARFLRCVGVVEINKWLVVNARLQNRKLRANLGHIKCS